MKKGDINRMKNVFTARYKTNEQQVI